MTPNPLISAFLLLSVIGFVEAGVTQTLHLIKRRVTLAERRRVDFYSASHAISDYYEFPNCSKHQELDAGLVFYVCV